MPLKSLNRGAVTELSEMNSMYHLNLSNEIADQDGWDYNCMGFALGTYDWSTMHACDDWGYESLLEEEDQLFYECIDELLHLYEEDRGPRMRQINNAEAEINENEYRIAFRFGDDDFHFLRQMEDEVWYEKCGASVLREFPLENLNANWATPNGEFTYESRIAYFAVEVA